jgi:hypothetical protein
MKRFLLIALAASALASGSGCCRGWFIWPGHYPHNPAFSQCCDPPWGPDPFGREGRRGLGGRHGHGGAGGRFGQDRPMWGKGSYVASQDGEECCYHSRGLDSLFPCRECRGDGRGAGAHGYPPAAGMQAAPGMYGAPGMYPGMYPGYGPQPAPDAASAAQIAYPYYTNRGPRDFLLGFPPGSQPPSIGP